MVTFWRERVQVVWFTKREVDRICNGRNYCKSKQNLLLNSRNFIIFFISYIILEILECYWRHNKILHSKALF